MGKYEPLTRFLATQDAERLPMTFREIEDVLGLKLPNSSRTHRAWWSNNPSNNVMTRAWLSAGYETADVDLATEKLLFRRTAKPRTPPSATPPQVSKPAAGAPPRPHPAFGAMKGLLTAAPGVDLTEPADPEWMRAGDE